MSLIQTLRNATVSAILIPVLLTGTRAGAEDLNQVYDLALTRDAIYQAAQAQYLAAREASPQARSFLLPQFNAFGEYGRSDTSIRNDQTFGDRDFGSGQTQYGLNASQVIFDRELFIGLDQAEKSVMQAEAEVEAARQDLILRVASAYFDVLSAEDTVRFTGAAKEAIYKQLEQAEKRFDVGLIAITDVKEAQADFDNARALEIAAINDLSIAKSSLWVVVGERLGEIAKLSERMPLISPEPQDIQEWIDKALEQNLDLIATRLASENAQLEVKRQRSGHYPRFGLDATANQNNADGGTFGGRNTGTLGFNIRMDLPIYSGGRVNSLTREARHDFQRAQETLVQTQRDTTKQAADSYLTVLSNISRVEALKQAVESNQASYEATQAGFDVGTRTSVDVSLAIQGLFSAERDYAISRYEYLLATLSLKRSAGTLTVNDIEKINTWLD
ncbi:MAG: TolC family outer membrane protein [Pseudomonadota bacterium]|nr:TolC family outer membrane protein [Pseudomonadota bacterium]